MHMISLATGAAQPVHRARVSQRALCPGLENVLLDGLDRTCALTKW
jgi:hypothetical protein